MEYERTECYEHLRSMISNYLCNSSFPNVIDTWIATYISENYCDEMFSNEEYLEYKEQAYGLFIQDVFDTHIDSVDTFYQYLSKNSDLKNVISVSDFVYVMRSAHQWYYRRYGVDYVMHMVEEEEIWNCIAHWFVETSSACTEDLIPIFYGAYENKLKEEMRFREGKYAYSCVVCYEKRSIYAFCGTCKSGALCEGCYMKVNNKCPCCRDKVIHTIADCRLSAGKDYEKWRQAITPLLYKIRAAKKRNEVQYQVRCYKMGVMINIVDKYGNAHFQTLDHATIVYDRFKREPNASQYETICVVKLTGKQILPNIILSYKPDTGDEYNGSQYRVVTP